MTIEWSDKFSIGDAEIDSQHQTLFKVVNIFFDSCNEVNLLECAKQMSTYVQEHFKSEEEYLRKIGYPDYIKHIKQHDVLVFGLNRMRIAMVSGIFDLKKSEKFFYDWVNYHVLVEDVKLLKFTKP